MDEFRSEYCATLALSERDQFLADLAAEYHRRTEAYDRTVCTGPVTRDGVMPATNRELCDINRNALAVLAELVKRAQGDREGLLSAIRRWDGAAEESPPNLLRNEKRP